MSRSLLLKALLLVKVVMKGLGKIYLGGDGGIEFSSFLLIVVPVEGMCRYFTKYLTNLGTKYTNCFCFFFIFSY